MFLAALVMVAVLGCCLFVFCKQRTQGLKEFSGEFWIWPSVYHFDFVVVIVVALLGWAGGGLCYFVLIVTAEAVDEISQANFFGFYLFYGFQYLANRTWVSGQCYHHLFQAFFNALGNGDFALTV